MARPRRPRGRQAARARPPAAPDTGDGTSVHGRDAPTVRNGVGRRARALRRATARRARALAQGAHAFGGALARRPVDTSDPDDHRGHSAAVDDGRALLDGLRAVGAALVSPFVTADPPPHPPQRWRLLARAAPALLWVAAAVIALIGTMQFAGNYRVPAPLVPVFAVLYALPLGLVHRTPLRAWRLTFVVALVSPFAVSPIPPQTLPWPATQVLVALAVCFGVAVRHRWLVVVAVLAASAATLAWTMYVTGVDRSGAPLPGAVVLIAVVLLVGYLIGVRGDLARRLDEGERLRFESDTQRAVLEERARIARELHDIVAHHMSMISVQAETAPFRVPDLGEQGRVAMTDIAATARTALTEMRRLLGVLRAEEHDAERAPQPGLAQLDQLVAGARRAGLDVEASVSGAPRALPQGIELCAYRIVQEAVSNAAIHAPEAAVRVALEYDATRLRLQVVNGPAPQPLPGSPAPAPQTPGPQPRRPGHGLVGMRERATLVGGTLKAGPHADGGYRVVAVLPVEPEERP